MLYLSIDVGIRNCGYVLYESTTRTLLRWDSLELCSPTENASKISLIDIGKQISAQFHTIFSSYTLDIVVIENQIGQNAIRMKAIQGMITMFFIEQGCQDIRYWNACHKLKGYDIPPKTTYAQRKKLSISITTQCIHETYPDWIEVFRSHKKKDDLADCFLQLMDVLRKEPTL